MAIGWIWRPAGMMAVVGALALSAIAARGEAAYTRKATWAETMLATRAAHVAAKVAADDEDTTVAWMRFEADFPLAAMRLGRDLDDRGLRALLTAADAARAEKKMIAAALQGVGAAGLERELKGLGPGAGSSARLELYERACTARRLAEDLKLKVNFRALRMAIEDLARSYPDKNAGAKGLLARAGELEARLPGARRALAGGSAGELKAAGKFFEDYTALQREALLANPLLDFEKLLLIKRKPLGNPYRYADPDKGTGKYIGMPQQSSYQLHTMPGAWAFSFDNEIAALPIHRPEAALETVFKSTKNRLVSDMDLHFDGDRVLFSMPDERKLWQLFEYDMAKGRLRQVSRGDHPDVHNLDGCYLPGGQIAFISTAVFQGVPCNPSVNVGMMYSMDGDGGNVRQLTFDQDHNFSPTVTPDGRIMYLRWEYADIPHVWARYIFTMNPDGTSQRELFGTGSYWPNGMWYARPVPGSPAKFAAIVTGHHVGRQGELYIFDPAKSHDGTKGCVQQIPGWGKPVKPIIADKLTETVYPKFLHPWPLSEKYLLVACRPTPEDMWGIYLVDVFDNMVPVKTMEGWALLEPTPLKKTPTPPALESRVNLARKDSLIYINDIYKGRGLEGAPRGVVKSLRLVTYHFAYRTVAGIDHRVGADGPWEPKVILGTVPVEADGSVFFRAPANTPLTVHALDEKGRTIQIMRSWMTAMPGEILSCVGCHEQINCAPPNAASVSLGRRPVEIKPWRGPARGFDFVREVQPALDKYCVGCHDGARPELPNLTRDQEMVVAYKKDNPDGKLVKGPITEELYKQYGGLFPPSYIALRRLVRPSGIESDLRPLNSMEFDARTTELVQMLEKGHHGVKLDDEAWDRLYTWIDLNAPCHGTWQEVVGRKKIANDHERRLAMMKAYSGIYEDPEVTSMELAAQDVTPVKPEPQRKIEAKPVSLEGWPFEKDAAARQRVLGETRRTLDLGGGVTMELTRIPAGRFVMGSASGAADEGPQQVVEINKPFWMGVCEVSNAQFSRFNPEHDSRFEHKGTWKFEEVDLGWPLNDPKQPVVRISWEEAMGFCAWLAARTGARVSLPSEAQWEYACRAGAATPFWYGGLEADFAPFANLGDASLRALAWGLRGPKPPDLTPREDRVNDGLIVTGAVGGYKANPWGLHDMHGNVWEWTRSIYKGYPYKENDGGEKTEGAGVEALRTARGGSWNDRPMRCTASYRVGYPAWQRVYNVGFRVVLEEEEKGAPVRVAGR